MGSSQRPVEDGDLQAYLAGEGPAYVEAALAESPALRERLRLMRGANSALRRLFADAPLPGPTDMVDVATGQATAEQQLRVAAYLRASPAGRAEMAELMEGASSSRARPPALLSLALPALAAAGLKSGADDGGGPVFLSAELAAQVVVTVTPAAADTWQLRGYVDQRGAPVARARVTLHSALGGRRSRGTDDGGFFTFKDLAAGSYHLRITLDQGVLLTTPFALP